VITIIEKNQRESAAAAIKIKNIGTMITLLTWAWVKIFKKIWNFNALLQLLIKLVNFKLNINVL